MKSFEFLMLCPLCYPNKAQFAQISDPSSQHTRSIGLECNKHIYYYFFVSGLLKGGEDDLLTFISYSISSIS